MREVEQQAGSTAAVCWDSPWTRCQQNLEFWGGSQVAQHWGICSSQALGWGRVHACVVAISTVRQRQG